MKKKRMRVYLDAEDEMRVEMIQAVYGASRSGVMRVALNAAFEKLGLKMPTRELLKKSSTSAEK